MLNVARPCVADLNALVYEKRLPQGRQRPHHLHSFVALYGPYLAPPRTQVGQHLAQELSRRDHFQVHYRLQQHRGPLSVRPRGLPAFLPLLNAISDESTGLIAPFPLGSLFRSTTLYPASGPFCRASLAPFSTAEKYSLGTRPPCTEASKTIPLPLSNGSSSSHTWPNCPCPPVCRTNRPSILTGFVRASR